jgi:protein-L-isoaspartate O-methyltransferase
LGRASLRDDSNVEIVVADAVESAGRWGNATKVAVTFAVESLPAAWLAALPDRGQLVAPVGAPDRDQRLALVTKRRGRIIETDHGSVRYVKNRSPR